MTAYTRKAKLPPQLKESADATGTAREWILSHIHNVLGYTLFDPKGCWLNFDDWLQITVAYAASRTAELERQNTELRQRWYNDNGSPTT